MDFLDSPAVNYRKKKPKDTFQQELQDSLKKRRSRGLTADMTSDDSDEERLDTHPIPAARSNRPLSAKRRGNHPQVDYEEEELITPRSGRSTSPKALNLGDTLRPREASKFSKSLKGGDLSRTSKMTDRGWQNLDTITREGSGLSNEDLVFGQKKEQQEKNKENRYGRKTPNIFEKDPRKTPTELDKNESKKGIFGRKTPTKDDKRFSPRDYNEYGEKDWMPPTMAKVNVGDSDKRSISPSSSVGGGRRGPSYDPSLDFLRESPRSARESPRSGREKDRDIKFPSTPGREGKLYENKKQSRKTPSPDIFGKTTRDMLDVDLDEDELKETPRDRRRLGTEKNAKGVSGRKTPTEKTGRKTPTEITGRKTPTEITGRKTPTDRYGKKIPADIHGRKTPTGKDGKKSPLQSPSRKSPTDLFGIKKKPQGRKTPTSGRSYEKEKEDEEDVYDTKKANVLDFLTEDKQAGPKPKERRRLLRSESQDSITDEFSPTDKPGDKKLGKKAKPRPKSRERDQPASFSAGEIPHSSPPPDASSICEELTQEPEHASRKESPTMLELSSSGKERSEKNTLNDVINMVSSAQSQMRSTKIKPINPDKVKPKIQTMLHRPKPRYGSAPGTPSEPERTFDNAQDIRDAVYQEWYFNRMKEAKRREKEKKKKEEEERKKKEAEIEEKKLESVKSYEAWKEQKQDKLLEKKQIDHEKKMKTMAKVNEEEQKKKDAKKAFKLWSERKDETIVETEREKLEMERQKRCEEKQKKLNKKQNSITAYEKWKRTKDELIVKKVKDEEQEKKLKKKMERKERERRELEATKLYDKWMHKKEIHERRQKQLKHSKRFEEEEEYKPAWSPAGRTVPFGR